MNLSPTAAIDASLPSDPDFEHPPGFYLARTLSRELNTAFGTDLEFENWRDVGWATTLDFEGSEFEVFFAGGTEPNVSQWMLGVSALRQPGFIARLFGAKSTVNASAMRRITEEVHRILASDQQVSKVRWALNEDPSSSDIDHPGNLSWPGAGAT